jgi:hypothetical protein
VITICGFLAPFIAQLSMPVDSRASVGFPGRSTRVVLNITARNRKTWLTLAICIAWGISVIVALILEWLDAPDWLSPLNLCRLKLLATRMPSYPVVIAALAAVPVLVVLLMWIRRGRFLLGLAALLAVVSVAATCVRGQVVLCYAMLGVLSTLAAGLGHRILRAICPRLAELSAVSLLERLLLSMILGFGALSFVAFGLALSHTLYLGVVAVVLIVLAILCYPDCRQLTTDLLTAARSTFAAARQTDLRFAALVVALLFVCFQSSLMLALAPETEYDAMMYHLAFPQLYADHGGVIENPECLHSHFCHVVEMLYTLALVTAGQPLPQLLDLTVGLIILGLLFCLARRIAGPTAGWLAALVFYALPLIGWESGHALSDLFATLFVFAAVYAAVLWIDLGDNSLLGLAGCYVGLAVGAKLNTLLYVVPLGGLILAYLWLPGRFLPGSTEGRTTGERLRGMLRLGLTSLGIAAPWLVWEWVRTGNPVFPFYNGIFRSPLWEATNERMDFSTFGIGRGFVSFLRLPWDLTASPNRFGQMNMWGGLEALPLLCLPITLLWWPRRYWHLLWLPAGVLVGGTYLWFSQVKYLRYLSPVVPIMVVLAAVNGVALWTAFGKTPWRKALLSGFALLVAVAWFFDTRCWRVDGCPWQVVYGLQTSEEFLRSRMPEYDSLRYLAAQAEHRATRVFAYPLHVRLYGGDCIFYHRAISGHKPELILGHRHIPMSDSSQVVRALAEVPIDYLLMSYEADGRVRRGYECPLVDSDFLERCGEPVMMSVDQFGRRAYLYRFKPESFKSPDSEGPDTTLSLNFIGTD